jgi:hypothetical protein
MTKRRSRRSGSGFDWRAILSDPTFRDVVQQAMAVIVIVVGLITLPAHAGVIGGGLIKGWVNLLRRLVGWLINSIARPCCGGDP